MRPTSDGTGGDLAHIWLLPAEEQVDEQSVLPVDANFLLRCACRQGCDETHRRWYGWRLGAYLVVACLDEQPADMLPVARASDARQSK